MAKIVFLCFDLDETSYGSSVALPQRHGNYLLI